MTKRRPLLPTLLVTLLVSLAAGVLVACGGAHRQPHGPPPEYEEPEAPAWPAEAGAPDAMAKSS